MKTRLMLSKYLLLSEVHQRTVNASLGKPLVCLSPLVTFWQQLIVLCQLTVINIIDTKVFICKPCRNEQFSPGPSKRRENDNICVGRSLVEEVRVMMWVGQDPPPVEMFL